jgi:hypothetical protein
LCLIVEVQNGVDGMNGIFWPMNASGVKVVAVGRFFDQDNFV